MAIRPVDLQLAYMAAPQNAAALKAAQENPAVAQQAQAAAFAAEAVEREESVHAAGEGEGAKVRSRGDREGGHSPRRRKFLPNPPGAEGEPRACSPYDLPDGEHFIDVTA